MKLVFYTNISICDPFKFSKNEKTPLVYAYENGMLSVVEQLESRGCSLDVVSYFDFLLKCHEFFTRVKVKQL